MDGQGRVRDYIITLRGDHHLVIMTVGHQLSKPRALDQHRLTITVYWDTGVSGSTLVLCVEIVVAVVYYNTMEKHYSRVQLKAGERSHLCKSLDRAPHVRWHIPEKSAYVKKTTLIVSSFRLLFHLHQL